MTDSEQSILEQAKQDLMSEDNIIRHDAVMSLGECTSEEAIEILVKLLQDRSPIIKDEAVNSLILVGGENVAKVIVPLLYEDEVYLSNISVEILGRLGEVALPFVIPVLKETDDDVLKFAIDVIGLIGSKEPVNDLLPHLSHKNPNIKSATAVTLGKLKATDAIDNLVVLLKDEDEWVRFSTLDAIGLIGGDDVADKLLDIFKVVDLSTIAAIDALSMLAEPEDYKKVMQAVSAPGVIDVLNVETVVRFINKFDGYLNDNDKKVFMQMMVPKINNANVEELNEIFQGLASLKNKAALDELMLFAGTKDYDEDTRGYLKDAIVALADIGKLIAAMKKYPEHNLTFVEAFGDLKDADTVEPLTALLDTNPDAKVKRAAIEALGNIGTPNTFDILVVALKDSESNVRKNAVEALGKLGNDRVVPVLIDMLLVEEFDDVKECIGQSLSKFSGLEVESAYVSLLDNEDITIRVLGIDGLGNLKSEGSKNRLMEALDDDDARIRCECIRALGGYEDSDISEILSGALTDKDKQVRMTAIEALGNRGEEQLTIGGLEDEDMWVRFKVANILAERQVPESEEKLVELLKNDEIPVQVACAKALGTLSSKKAVETLKGLIDHEDSNLKNAATEALVQCDR